MQSDPKGHPERSEGSIFIQKRSFVSLRTMLRIGLLRRFAPRNDRLMYFMLSLVSESATSGILSFDDCTIVRAGISDNKNFREI